MPYSVYVRGFTKASSDFISGYQACSDGVRTSAYAGWRQAKPKIKWVAWSSIAW